LLRKKNFIFILHFLFDLGEPLRTKKARNAGFFWLASGYARFASLIPAQPLRVCLVRRASAPPLLSLSRERREIEILLLPNITQYIKWYCAFKNII
jgi:hypothetical protein